MLKVDLESVYKYTVVMKLLGREYSIDFNSLDTLADFTGVERGLTGVYRVQIIRLPAGVYTRKTENTH